MKVIVVEDDDWKRDQLIAIICEFSDEVSIIGARSVSSGLREIRRGGDMVLLDMSLPSFEGAGHGRGKPQGFGGREILAQMHLRKIEIPTILVTQYGQFEEGETVRTIEDVDVELRRRFRSYRGFVFFTADTTGWQDHLRSMIREVLAARPTEA